MNWTHENWIYWLIPYMDNCITQARIEPRITRFMGSCLTGTNAPPKKELNPLKLDLLIDSLQGLLYHASRNWTQNNWIYGFMPYPSRNWTHDNWFYGLMPYRDYCITQAGIEPMVTGSTDWCLTSLVHMITGYMDWCLASLVHMPWCATFVLWRASLNSP